MYKNETKKCIVPASNVEGVPSVLVSQAEGSSTVNEGLYHGSVVLGACQHQRCPSAKKEGGREREGKKREKEERGKEEEERRKRRQEGW